MEQITAPGEDEKDEQHAYLKLLTVIIDYRRRRTAAFPPRTDHWPPRDHPSRHPPPRPPRRSDPRVPTHSLTSEDGIFGTYARTRSG
ncbi:hypothetical protein SHIRM173S_04132 [Streptomyces hirsutus]